jgi:hypothetical protein
MVHAASRRGHGLFLFRIAFLAQVSQGFFTVLVRCPVVFLVCLCLNLYDVERCL